MRERAHLGDQDLDGRIILRLIFRNGMWRYGLNRAGSGQGQVAGTCKCDNEPSSSIECGNFLTSCKPVSFSRRTLLHGVRN
jgi:hypothetical protein